MELNNFHKFFFIHFATIILINQHQFAICQQLSYANAEIGQSLIRSTHPSITNNSSTLAPPVTTTAKSGFFSGIRNIFLRTTTPATTTATATATTTTTATKVPTARPVTYAVTSPRPHTPSPNLHNHGPIVQTQVNAHAPVIAQNPEIALKSDNWPSLPSPHGSQLPHSGSNYQANASRIPVRQPNGAANPGAPSAGPSHFIHQNIEISKRGDTHSRIPIAVNTRNHDVPTNNRSNRPSSPATPTSPPSFSSVLSHPSSLSGSQPSLAGSQSSLSGSQSSLSGSQSSSSLSNRNNHPPGGSRYPQLATTQEIEELSEELFRKATPNIFSLIKVNLQKQTRSSLLTDDAPAPLLSLNESVLDATPTLSTLRLLHNNYELDTTINEYVSAMERKEENDFLNAVLATPVMRTAMKFLQDKGIVTADPKTHFDLLKTLWFTLYPRAHGKVGSSAFEHVFLGEIKNHTSVSGLHNWVYYYSKEGQTGTEHPIDYKGYMNNILLGDKGQIVKYRFSYNNISKPVNAMFIGTLPELEMAIYTVCFQVKANKECPVSMGGKRFNIQTHTFKYRGKRLIGSAFPEI